MPMLYFVDTYHPQHKSLQAYLAKPDAGLARLSVGDTLKADCAYKCVPFQK